MTNWSGFSAQGLEDLVAPLRAVATGARESLNTVRRAMRGVDAVLAILSTIDNGSSDPIANTLRETIASLRSKLSDLDILETAARDGAIHLLSVPLISPYRKDVGPILAEVKNLTDLAMAFKLLKPPPTQVAMGGNYGMYTTIIESLMDLNDPNRPEYGDQAHIGCVVIMYGSADLATFINNAIRITNLFSSFGIRIGGVPDLAYQRPVPRNLKIFPATKLGATINAGDNEAKFNLRFDVPFTQFSRGGVGLITTVTSTSIFIKEGSSITPSDDLSSLLIGKLDADSREVNVSGLDPTKKYYVALAHTARMSELKPDGVTVELGPDFTGLSDQLRYVAAETGNRQTSPGRYPDWKLVGSIDLLIPPVSVAISSVLSILLSLESANAAARGPIYKIRASLNSVVTGVNYWLNQLDTALAPLAVLSELPTGAYVTSFQGKGGKLLLIDQLKEAFSAANNTLPPFKTGEEYVGGFVVVISSPTAAAVSRQISTIQKIFSGTDSTPTGVGASVDDIPRVADIQDLESEIAVLTAGILANSAVVESSIVRPAGPQSIAQLFPDDDGTCG